MPATNKTPAKKVAPAPKASTKKAASPIDAALAKFGISSRQGFNLASPDVVYAVRYKNINGVDIAFSVAHKNREMLEDDLLKLPVSLIPYVNYEPTLAQVKWTQGAKLERHYEFNDWFRLMSLLTPGTWYYLASPEEYKTARMVYAELDPLKRLFPHTSRESAEETNQL